ncbi:hypothetical protein HOLleu_38076 [Holothuria leucospilota]|uniref:Uncharacterized protein n=1 Tax=Holothuria leucospilota TaxID=206669 RepID=A0A9Q1BDV3_HOLLE|nr:hypothetical protein HOLleu_38076 [Holothuria leucospilota]
MADIHRKAKRTCCIQRQRFKRKHSDWRLLDLCIGLAGNIAVSGGDFITSRTFIDIYSSPPKHDVSTIPKLLYSREFDTVGGYNWRYVCFLEEPNEIVTGVYNTLEVMATNKNKVLRSFKVKDTIRCVSVAEKNIFIGSLSHVVYVFDKGLNLLKTIRLEGNQNYGLRRDIFFEDMEVVPGRFFVCAHKSVSFGGENHKALAFRGTDGKELHTFTTQGAQGVAACLEYGILCVLFSNRLEVFSLSGYHCLLVVDMDSWADKVSISNRGVMVTGKHISGEVKIYDIKALFTYDYLKKDLAFLLQGPDITKLLTYFEVSNAKTNHIMLSDSPKEALLQVLEDECIIESSNVERLKEAFKQLQLRSCFYAVQIYQKTRDSSTSYERFLTKFSFHLSGDVLKRLCKYFKVSGDLKKGILTSQNPGYSLLLNLSDREVITESNVTSLEEPMGNFGLAEAVADIRKYQLTVEEQKRELQTDADLVVPVSTSPSRTDYRTRRHFSSRHSSCDSFDSVEDFDMRLPYRSSSSLIDQRDAELWKHDRAILPSLPKTSYTQQERPSFLQNMKKWLGFGQPDLRGAAGDDSYLTSGLLDDDKKSKIEVAHWNRSRLLLPSSKIKDVRQQRPSFLTNLKKWLGFGPPEPTCDLDDTDESIHEWVIPKTTSAQDADSAYLRRLRPLMIPELESIEKGARSSIRLSRRDQIRNKIENVAQSTSDLDDNNESTSSLESAPLDEAKGPQSVVIENIKKSDDIVEKTKTSQTEAEVPENLEDLEKFTQNQSLLLILRYYVDPTLSLEERRTLVNQTLTKSIR